jgi:hypothetical protein
MIRIRHFCGCLLATVLSLAPAGADEPDPAHPQIIKLTLHGAAPGRPALRNRLMADVFERKPGNAAQFYYRALLMYAQNPGRKELEQQSADHDEQWWNNPCEGEVRDQIKKWLATFPPHAVEQLREATQREQCDFDYRLRERGGIEIISFLLPEIQEMRTFGRYLRYKARVEISERKYDDALASLRMGYRLGKDAGSERLLINGLVGIAISSITNSEVEHWIGSPESPNLYWPLASLQQPLVDLRPALEQEVRFPEIMFPFLKDAETSQRSAEEWQRVLNESVRQIGQIQSNGPPQSQNPLDQLQTSLATTALIMRAYPVAKEELKNSGLDTTKVEKMPVAQVVAIQMQRTVRILGDEFAKGAYLPIKQREEYYAALDDRMRKEGFFGPNSRELIPLASLLMPAVGNALSAQTRLERDFAALQTLEAIRAHLAETESLPEKLSDITALPVPLNPCTNEPFEYRVADGQATLEVPPVNKRQSPQSGKRYVLTAAKK